MHDIRDRTIGGVAWCVLEAFSTQTLALLAFLILARLLTPEDFGLIALANLYVFTCQMLISQGFGEALVQFKKVDACLINSAFWTINTIAAGLVVLTFLLSHPIALWFGDERLCLVLRWLSPMLVISSLIAIPHALLEREMAFRVIAQRTFISYLAGGLVGISMAGAGWGVWSLVGQQLAGGACNTITLWSTCNWRPRPQFSTASVRTLLRFGTSICGIQVLTQISRRSDQFFIGKFLGLVSTGIYAIGARFSALANDILVTSVSKVSYTAFSRIQEDSIRSLNGFYKIVRIQTCLSLPLFLGASLLSPEIVSVCLGHKWLNSVPVVQILLLSGPFDLISGIIGATIIAAGKPNRSLLITAAHAAVNITLFAFVIRWGILAVAAAYCLRAALLVPVELIFLRTVLPVNGSRLVGILTPLAAAAATMCGLVALVRFGLSGCAPAAIVAIGGIATGAVSYTGMLFLIQRNLFNEILRHGSVLIPRRWRKVSESAEADAEPSNLPLV